MHLIILPGNSKEYNEQWLKDSAEAYKDMFDSVTSHIYKHWKVGENMIDTEHAAKELTKITEKLDEYVIFAKSAGTIVTVRAVVEKNIAPTKCIFVGSPWGSIGDRQNDFSKALSNYHIPTLFIQQTDDMFFSYSELEETINSNKVKGYKLIETPGSNHAYDNYEEIKQWMKDFLEA